MSEEDAIRAASAPRTAATLRMDLAALGVRRGMTLLVHSSLSSLGWVAGGAQAVILALLESLGPEGTLVLPGFSSGNTDPRYWQAPPIPEAWWPIVRDEMPPFGVHCTPTRGVGAIPECFRSWPRVCRSSHPAMSFCALGPAAAEITRDHSLDEGLGEGSPLARLYERGSHVLLLGVGHGNNTSMHLCEYRAKWTGKRYIEQGGAVYVDGARTWVAYLDLALCDDDFERIGADFEDGRAAVRIGRIGSAKCRLMPQRALVDFGVAWMERHRG